MQKFGVPLNTWLADLSGRVVEWLPQAHWVGRCSGTTALASLRPKGKPRVHPRDKTVETGAACECSELAWLRDANAGRSIIWTLGRQWHILRMAFK